MNEVNFTASGADWTHLLADPLLVRHLGQLLQVYRDASPAQRDQALIDAIHALKHEAKPDSPQESLPAVPLLAPVPPFNPKFFTPARGDERRISSRIKCCIAVEMRLAASGTPVWGNLANTSSGGCFVETAFPLPAEAPVEIGLWISSGQIWVKGIVLSGFVTRSSPSLGVRVKFSDLLPDERESLRQFLRFIENANQGHQGEHAYLAKLRR